MPIAGDGRIESRGSSGAQSIKLNQGQMFALAEINLAEEIGP